MIPLSHWLLFTCLLFLTGVYGALTRRSVIGILIALEIIFSAGSLNLVLFSRMTSLSPQTGQIFAFFVMLLGLAAAVTGAALILSLARVRKTTDSEELNLLKW